MTIERKLTLDERAYQRALDRSKPELPPPPLPPLLPPKPPPPRRIPPRTSIGRTFNDLWLLSYAPRSPPYELPPYELPPRPPPPPPSRTATRSYTRAHPSIAYHCHPHHLGIHVRSVLAGKRHALSVRDTGERDQHLLDCICNIRVILSSW